MRNKKGFKRRNPHLAKREVGVVEVPLADHLPLLGFRVQREDHSLVLANAIVIISAIVMMMMMVV